MQQKYTEIKAGIPRWDVIYHVVSSSGKSHNPRSFAIDILKNLKKIIEYDVGLAFFLDQNGKIIGTERTKSNEMWDSIYEEYFSYIENKPYEYFQPIKENPLIPTINVHSWKEDWNMTGKHFFEHPTWLKYSCGFALYDLNGHYKTTFSLDRHYDEPFSNDDLYNLQLAVIQLNQLHKNFYYRDSELDVMRQSFWQKAELTAREIEIVDFLVQGISPKEIAKILYISMSTTYKHITHIYSKLNVSNRQEMMCVLLSGTNKNDKEKKNEK